MQDLSERKKMYLPVHNIDYRSCKLTEGDEWFISFYVKNPATGKLKRIRIKCNRIPQIRERRKVAREMMTAIDRRLALGWNPLMEAAAPKAFKTLDEAFDSFLNIKRKESEPDTMRSYDSFIKTFRTWLRANGVSESAYANSVSHDVAMLFMSDKEETLSAKTYNNYLSFYSSLFNWMVKKGYCDVNPFDGIEKKAKRLLGKNRRLFTDKEFSELVDYLQKNNREYLAMAMLCYCCFIRPKELSMLKCSDIDLKNQVVHVACDVAKNDNDSYRTIPNDLLPILRSLDYSHPDWYLFGQHPDIGDFSPSKVRACSRKYAKWWDQHVRADCGFGQDLQFYSLKDTGITNMIEDGVPINLVQQQADHSSVAMTAVYVGKKPDASLKIKQAEIMRIGG